MIEFNFEGYKRKNNTVGIRNRILVIATDECCDGVARKIAGFSSNGVVLTNHYTCMLGGNEETYLQMIEIAVNPNIYGVIIISMGCGSINPFEMSDVIKKKRKDDNVFPLSLQKEKGGINTIKIGQQLINKFDQEIRSLKTSVCSSKDLIIGVKCGGSDFTSGFTSNPSVGLAVDKLVEGGSTCIAGELFELAGCEELIRERFISKIEYDKFISLISKEIKRWNVGELQLETMSVGNYCGGLTTIEEKSLGALYKTGTCKIQGALEISFHKMEKPTKHGFYLSDVTMLCGGSETNFAALGCQAILWTTSSAAVDSLLTPTITVSGNSKVINDDICIDATGVETGTDTYETISENIIKYLKKVCDGAKTQTEDYSSTYLTLFQKDRRVETILFSQKCFN